MSEFLKVLMNIRSLRAAAREVSLEQLEEGLEKLSLVVEERRNEEASQREAQEERKRKINQYIWICCAPMALIPSSSKS